MSGRMRGGCLAPLTECTTSARDAQVAALLLSCGLRIFHCVIAPTRTVSLSESHHGEAFMNEPLGLPIEQESISPPERIDLIVVKLPFVHPFGTSVQVWTHKEALLLRYEGGGVVAWSECVADPDPYYLSETTGTVRHILREFLLPALVAGSTLGGVMTTCRHVRGHEMAKATLENALVVALALEHNVPLHTLLGCPERKIPSGISIGLRDTCAELLDAVESAVERNYHRVKMKIKRGKDVEWVRAVRERFPDIQLMVDANGDYTMHDAAHLRQLDAFGLTMIEQPLSYSDIYQHSLLQKQLRTPLCLDECLHGIDDVAAAIALDACRIINIKQGRVGGILESIRIARYAKDHNIGVWSGGMDETGIGRALNIHLQTADGFSLPGDTSETRNYFTEDIVDPPVVLDRHGFIGIPPGPGLGVSVDPDRLLKYMIHAERII